MSNYTPILTNSAGVTKDAIHSTISAAELGTEFDAIKVATDSKQNATDVLGVAYGGTGAATSGAAPFALKGANTDITSLTATGVTRQIVYTNYTAYASGSVAIPIDDTKPQITEGYQFMTQAITPKSASSLLAIDILFNGSCDVGNILALALFQDATADAISASWGPITSANNAAQFVLRHTIVAGTTSATTFTLRCGTGPGNLVQMNGASGARYFGGAMVSSIKITEYNP